MSRDYRVWLEDILESIGKIFKYTVGMELEDFKEDDKTIDAVVRNLEIIGEAAKKVPASVRDAHSEVEWVKISGLRDIMIHEYFGLDVEIIWDVVRNKLPQLKNRIEKILS